MSRLLPFRPKASEEIAARIQQTLDTTLYLVQTTGPTSYVVQEQNCERKHKVLIGSLQSCSCGTADICIHILFVMLKVLRVPATTPVVWQKSLLDSEIEMLLGGGFRETSRPTPKPYVKKRKEAAGTQPEETAAERHELVEGEVCAVCQEDMDDAQPLTFCRKGCGNNFHIECMKVFGESRKQSKENIICPLCRQDWGDTGLTTLRKEMDAANRAPNVHKGASCRKCKTKPIRCERFRCVQCKNVDLCARCFKANAHEKHAFVMKQNVSDPWIPAFRANRPQAAISSDLIRDLENRELSTNDYDVLLQLDQGGKHSFQDYLVKLVPGTKVTAEKTNTFGAPGATCSLCAQSLRIKASLHSALCGHVFHESCLARSILSQMFACPYPGCDQALLPGLLYLQLKHKPREVPTEQAQVLSSTIPVLDPLFSVLGIRQQCLGVQTTGVGAAKVSKAKRGSVRTRREDNTLPSIPGLLSLGIVPSERRSTPTSNQLEHESTTSSRTSSSTRTKGKISRTTRPRQALPPLQQNQQLSPISNHENVTESRLNHAEQIRAELKAVEKDRLQKQRAQREERQQRHKENNDNQAFTGGFLGAELVEMPRSRVFEQRAQQSREMKRKSKERQQHARQQNQLESTLPDLFVGSRR